MQDTDRDGVNRGKDFLRSERGRGDGCWNFLSPSHNAVKEGRQRGYHRGDVGSNDL